jgi:hypothetical protein
MFAVVFYHISEKLNLRAKASSSWRTLERRVRATIEPRSQRAQDGAAEFLERVDHPDVLIRPVGFDFWIGLLLSADPVSGSVVKL